MQRDSWNEADPRTRPQWDQEASVGTSVMRLEEEKLNKILNVMGSGDFFLSKIVIPHRQHPFNECVKLRFEERWLSSWKQLFGASRKKFP